VERYLILELQKKQMSLQQGLGKTIIVLMQKVIASLMKEVMII
jgi:hypothetical protein